MDTILPALIGAIATILAAIIGQGIRIRLWKRKLTWDDALRTAQELLTQIQGSDWQPEIVLGIGRSGGIWGGWLAGNLGSLPFAVVDVRYSKDKKDKTVKVGFPLPLDSEILLALLKPYPGKRRLLVVEGASSTGTTLIEFMEKFSKELEGYDVKFCVLYQNPTSKAQIDFVGVSNLEPWPAKFPWHYTDLYRPYIRDLFS